MFQEILEFIRAEFKSEKDFIPLQEPQFSGNEKQYLSACIDSTYVSSVGQFVAEFENKVKGFSGSEYAVSVVNGTAALHISLLVLGVEPGHLVITQPLTFIATCNAIKYTGADPVFVDVDRQTMGLSPDSLLTFLECETTINERGQCIHVHSGKIISACVPMHTYGHPVRIKEVQDVCKRFNIAVLEDATESVGSEYMNQQTGSFGDIGVYSFNGNKIITSGGGGMILTNNKDYYELAQHLTTQAKVPHAWVYAHDVIGYNYRSSNLHAAVGLAQLECLETILESKRAMALKYEGFFDNLPIEFVKEPLNSKSNYWLNTVLMKDDKERQAFLQYSNDRKVMTRPAWKLMTSLPMFENCISASIPNAEWLEQRIVNLPSSFRKG